MTPNIRSSRIRRATLAAAASALAASGALAGNLFGDYPSTADGYATWDSDLANIEGVAETGNSRDRAVTEAKFHTGRTT